MSWACTGVSGVGALSCISANTNYVPGYVFLLLVFAVMFFRLSREGMRERMAATFLVVALISAIGSYESMLFPEQFFIASAVMFIGASVMLVIRS